MPQPVATIGHTLNKIAFEEVFFEDVEKKRKNDTISKINISHKYYFPILKVSTQFKTTYKK